MAVFLSAVMRNTLPAEEGRVARLLTCFPDGNNIDGDGCSASCLSDETCGNGIEDNAVGESCDDGNAVACDGCSVICQLEGCGNGVQECSEACDDGNNIDGDGCSATCISDETCGNGIVDTAVGEACDDGNNIHGDGCQADCALPARAYQIPRNNAQADALFPGLIADILAAQICVAPNP